MVYHHGIDGFQNHLTIEIRVYGDSNTGGSLAFEPNDSDLAEQRPRIRTLVPLRVSFPKAQSLKSFPTKCDLLGENQIGRLQPRSIGSRLPALSEEHPNGLFRFVT